MGDAVWSVWGSLTTYEQSIYGHYRDICKIRTYRINDVWMIYMYSLTANQLTSIGLAQACLINIKWLVSQFHHIQWPKKYHSQTDLTNKYMYTHRQTERQTDVHMYSPFPRNPHGKGSLHHCPRPQTHHYEAHHWPTPAVQSLFLSDPDHLHMSDKQIIHVQCTCIIFTHFNNLHVWTH